MTDVVANINNTFSEDIFLQSSILAVKFVGEDTVNQIIEDN